MADYASFLYNAFGGVGDAIGAKRQENRHNLENDRDYAAQMEKFGWQKGVDQRNFDYQGTRDKVGDSHWEKGFGLQERELGANNAYRNRSLDLQERAANRRDILPLVNAGGGKLYDQNTGQWITPPASTNGSVSLDNESFDNISGVRKEIQGLPSYKNFAQAMPIYKSMIETAGRDSKASDLNLVYGLGKIMDPNSVVREGEMVMVKNTASLPDWLQGAISQLNGGAALRPETRNAIMQEAQGRIQGYQSQFGQDSEQYKGIASRYGINQADIIPNFGEVPKWPGIQPQQGSDWNDVGGGIRMRQVK